MKKDIYAQLIGSSKSRISAYIVNTSACKEEFLEKNDEYGPTWLAYRMKPQIVRIWNKASRVRSIQEKKEQQISDSIVSEFDAIYNYSIIALIVIDRMKSDSTASSITLDPEYEKLDEPYLAAQEKCLELFKKKDHDYDGAWVKMEISSIVDEILVKLMRAARINKKDLELEAKKVKFSEIFMDIANYAMFASILIKEVEIDPLE